MRTEQKWLWSNARTILRLFILFAVPLILIYGNCQIVDAQEVQAFSSGIFHIYQAGKEVGTEEYTLSKVANSWKLDSVISLLGISMEQHLEANLDAEMLDYRLSIVAGGQIQEIAIEQAGGELDYGVKVGSNLVFSKTLTGSALVLDNNIWSHYILAIAQYDRAKGGAQQLKILVPQAVPNGLGIANVSIQLIGTTDDLDEYSINLMGITVNVWANVGTHEITKITIPAQSIEAMCKQPPENIASMPETEPLDLPAVPASVIEREVAFEGYETTLRGSLSLPSRGTGPWPGIILIAGSGPTDRDGNTPLISGRVDNLRTIAHSLSASGYAVLRYDKRGVGQSDSITSVDDIAFDYFVQDVVYACDYLKSQEEVIRDAISLIGHSEGALLSLVAASQIAPKSVVLLAGSGQPLGQTLLVQVGTQLDALVQSQALSSEEQDKAIRDLLQCIVAVTEGRPYDMVASQVSPLIESLILSLVNQRPFTQKALSVDPTAYFLDLDCPVLIVQGGADTQVLWTDAIALLKAAREAELITTLSYFPFLDHVFKPAPGGPKGYAEPNRTVDEDFLEQLIAWMDWVHEDVAVSAEGR